MAAMYGRPIDLAAILESQQPEIDLKLKDLEVSSRNFMKAVSFYTSRAIEEITSRKTRYTTELKKAAEKKQQAEAEITACKVKEIKLMEGARHSALLLAQLIAASVGEGAGGEEGFGVVCGRIEATVWIYKGEMFDGRR